MRGPHPGQAVQVLAVIPARGGSKGLARKNLRLLGGRPLLHYTIREAHAAKLVDASIVSTDDAEIAAVATSLGADVPFMRPADLAADDSRDIDYLSHALDWVADQRGWQPDIVVLLLPTTPSRCAADIDGAVDLLQRTGADSVRSVVQVPHVNAYKMWTPTGSQGRIRPLFAEGAQALPRQQLPSCLLPVALVYAMRAANIRAGSLWGEDVRMILIDFERFTDIDTERDLADAEATMARLGLV